jgi:hypothetical protein
MLSLIGLLVAFATGSAAANPDVWRMEWPDTDFSRHTVDFGEIMSGGPPKDGIPSIDDPDFEPVAKMTDLPGREPVVGLSVNGVARAYPLRILTWHEIVNDVIGGVPVAVTYCPLCNAAIVFDRRLDGQVLEFGTTGKLRNSDLVMYDRQTESWWQQFLGRAIVGELTGKELAILPARLESWDSFKTRHPEGEVLVQGFSFRRPYGNNPYEGYDTSRRPFLYRGEFPEGIAPMAYVIAVGEQAWSLELLRREGRLETDELVLSWTPGAASALDTRRIAEGRDIGNVVVQGKAADGALADVAYDLTFAFVFHAFRPDGTIHQ